jgi:hypothetical protein
MSTLLNLVRIQLQSLVLRLITVKDQENLVEKRRFGGQILYLVLEYEDLQFDDLQFDNFQTLAGKRYLQMHLLVERLGFFFLERRSGFSERASQVLSKGINVAS